MSSRGENLVKNSVVLAIGNIGSRIVKFFLVPLYAYFLSKEDVGLYDLIFTLGMLLGPISNLKISDAVYRYLIAGKGENDALVWTGALFSFSCTAVVLCLLSVFFPADMLAYKIEVAVFLSSMVFYTYFSEVIRGYRRNNEYAVGGVILAFITLALSLLSLYIATDKLSALLLSTATSNFIVGFYFAWRCGFYKHKPVLLVASLRSLLAYSIPIIPAAISWWAMRLSNRFFVTAKLGLDQNAIIAIAMTLPNVIVVMGGIFYMAWQESSFTNINASDRDKYFSMVYNRFINLQFLLCTVVFLGSELMFNFLFPNSYGDSWRLSYFFFWGAIFNNLSAFLSVGYLGTFNTRGDFYTAVLGAAASVAVTWCLLPMVNALAAPLGYFSGLFIVWLVRSFHTRQYFKVDIEWSTVGSSVAALSISGVYLLVDGIVYKLIVAMIALTLVLHSNRTTLIDLSKKISGWSQGHV